MPWVGFSTFLARRLSVAVCDGGVAVGSALQGAVILGVIVSTAEAEPGSGVDDVGGVGAHCCCVEEAVVAGVP